MTQQSHNRGNGRREGERRKDESLGLLRVHRELWIRRVQRNFLKSLLRDGPSTSDAVSDETPGKIRRNCLGAAINHLARLGLIESVGYAVSTRPERHACVVRVWRILDAAKAESWLATHPDLADPAADVPTAQQTLFFVDESTPAAGTTGADDGLPF